MSEHDRKWARIQLHARLVFILYKLQIEQMLNPKFTASMSTREWLFFNFFSRFLPWAQNFKEFSCQEGNRWKYTWYKSHTNRPNKNGSLSNRTSCNRRLWLWFFTRFRSRAILGQMMYSKPDLLVLTRTTKFQLAKIKYYYQNITFDRLINTLVISIYDVRVWNNKYVFKLDLRRS